MKLCSGVGFLFCGWMLGVCVAVFPLFFGRMFGGVCFWVGFFCLGVL